MIATVCHCLQVIKSQKYPVARQMEVKFRQYLVRKRDMNELLLFSLRKLFQEAASLSGLRRAPDADPDAVQVLEVEVEDFEARARELRIVDLTAFYTSDLFTGGPKPHHGFARMRNANNVDVIVKNSHVAAAAEEENDAQDNQAAEREMAAE